MTAYRRSAAAVAATVLLASGGAGAAYATNPDNTNPAYWEALLEEEGFVNVACEKAEGDYSNYGEYMQVPWEEDGELEEPTEPEEPTPRTSASAVDKQELARSRAVWGEQPSTPRLAIITCDDAFGYLDDGHTAANFVVIAEG